MSTLKVCTQFSDSENIKSQNIRKEGKEVIDCRGKNSCLP